MLWPAPLITTPYRLLRPAHATRGTTGVSDLFSNPEANSLVRNPESLGMCAQRLHTAGA